MTPLEAYAVIYRCMNELHHFREYMYPKSKSYSQEEITAQVIAFEALRRMEEEQNDES